MSDAQALEVAVREKTYRFRVGSEMCVENFANTFHTVPELQYMHRLLSNPGVSPAPKDIELFYQVFQHGLAPHLQHRFPNYVCNRADNHEAMKHFVLWVVRALQSTGQDMFTVFGEEMRAQFRQQFRAYSTVKEQEKIVERKLRQYVQWRFGGALQRQYELACALHDQLLCSAGTLYGGFRDEDGCRPLALPSTVHTQQLVARTGRTTRERTMYGAFAGWARQQGALLRHPGAVLTELAVVPLADIEHEQVWARATRALTEPARVRPSIATDLEWFDRAVARRAPNQRTQYTGRAELLRALNGWRLTRQLPEYTSNSPEYKELIYELERRGHRGRGHRWNFTLRNDDTEVSGGGGQKRTHEQAFDDEIVYLEGQMRQWHHSIEEARERIKALHRALAG